MDSKKNLDLKNEKNDFTNEENEEITKVLCDKAYYITLDGEGDQVLSERHSEGIEALQMVANALKNHYKSTENDFTISPLNILWWVNDKEDCKEKYKWRLMIEIASFVSEEIFIEKRKEAFTENNIDLINEVLQREMNEGLSFQSESVGEYNREDKMAEFNKMFGKKGYTARGFYHEIYLDNPLEVESGEVRRIIRQPAFKEIEDELDYDKVKQEFFYKLGDTKIMVLATTDNKKVSARNMSIVINKEKFYFQTDYNFDKCRDIEINRNVALCVDNIQIEGKITYIGDFYEDKFEDFKRIFKLKHKGSYEGYSKLMENKIFEIMPTKISLYKYEGSDIYRVFIDIHKNKAYRRYYLRN